MTDGNGSETHLVGRRGVRYGCVLVAIAMLATAAVAPAVGTSQSTDSASELPAEPAFILALDADGSARVTLTVTFDLSTDSERVAFETLRENTTARERRTDQFTTRLEAVAAGTENATGRSMSVRDPGIAFTERNGVGIVALSATWEGIAAQDGDRIVLREPFASGFDLDLSFRVVGPDGYELATTSPSPTTQSRNSATWGPEADFAGFESTFAPGENAAETGDGESLAASPGFGVGAGVIALLLSTVLLVSRRRNRQ